MGYGHASPLRTSKILRLSDDLPLIVEIVDSAESIQAFLPVLDAMFNESGGGGLVTLESVQVLQYEPQTAT
jgi:PII-like signaling protein